MFVWYSFWSMYWCVRLILALPMEFTRFMRISIEEWLVEWAYSILMLNIASQRTISQNTFHIFHFPCSLSVHFLQSNIQCLSSCKRMRIHRVGYFFLLFVLLTIAAEISLDPQKDDQNTSESKSTNHKSKVFALISVFIWFFRTNY